MPEMLSPGAALVGQVFIEILDRHLNGKHVEINLVFAISMEN